MDPVRFGVIGGSGLYHMPELTDQQSVDIDTPFGKPSAPVMIGTLRGQRVAFIPRHGLGHRYTPSEVPYRANIYALKMLGVSHVISVSACGSLREDYAPGHIVIPDGLFDFTRDRQRTFFGGGLVAHISVADSFCPAFGAVLADAVQDAGGTVHRGGTFITVEGPRFSTKGESVVYRQWGMSIIGMTASPEAFLAREAEMHYAVMAHVTDYDVWHESEEAVTVDMVIATLHRNLEIAQRAIALTVERAAGSSADPDCGCENALAAAVLTDRKAIPAEVIRQLSPLVGKYFR